MQSKGRPAAFFDRDGTINVNTGHLFEPDKLVFIEKTVSLIQEYNRLKWPVIVVTNQAGIAKGIYSEEDMQRLHEIMNQRLQLEFGARINAFYYCPHHPDYTGACSCRKPEPGMLLQAAKEWNIDLGRSVFYGDSQSDMEAARRAGVKGVLISE